MAKGYALIDDKGDVFVQTVAHTERGAKVNALVSLYKTPVFQQDSDEKIDRMFEKRPWQKHRVVAVNVQPVELI